MKTELERVQLVETEILKVIDRICKENKISYSLYAGTLLGAVRHKGFIPWDDDIDICMSRVDYDRFLEAWQRQSPKGYILQNKENTPAFSQTFSKIRKDHTTFLEGDYERGLYHAGIFVDVFPFDRIPADKLHQAVFRWNCMIFQLLTREYVPANSNPVVKLGSKFLLFCVPQRKRKAVREKLLREITKYKHDKSLGIVSTEVLETLKLIYPSDMLDNFVEMEFENELFPCVADWDLNLKMLYGDYMKLPPEEERVWKHHPILIDFEHNYEELESND